MVLLILEIPSPMRLITFQTLTFTILGIYPVATALIGKILKDQSDGNDRKRAELELIKAKERAESADRLKTAFMNNISHEVRTPLNSILGFGNLIAQPDISNEEKAQYYTHIKTSSNRLLNTITNYMDISLIASGNIEVRKNSVDLHKIFQHLYNHFKPLCSEKNLGLHLDIPERTEQFIFQTDSELFWKIMSHLLDNAIKFTNSGRINFGFNVKPEVESEEIPKLEFFVKDTGIGIGTESFTLIFESFKQEEVSRSRGFEGSGLGLSIAQGLVKLLGGEMHVTSAKGVGSMFFFSMEFHKSVIAENAMQTVDLPSKQEKPVILIAEDDESNLMFLQVILRKKYVSIITALNGQEAVAKCQDHPEISLVLMDIKMPVMDGLEATREIKSFRKDLPIIACTAFALSGDAKMVEEAGCDDYISKPVNKEGLLEKLRKYGVMV
jgi:signal transduction histidine kinase/CheY-like chemotaxis protein